MSQNISLFSFFFSFYSLRDSTSSSDLYRRLKFLIHEKISCSCSKASSPPFLMSLNILSSGNSFLDRKKSFLVQHFLYKLSIVISICPCSVVFFIFLVVFSSLSASSYPLCSSIFSSFFCFLAILLFRVIFSVFMRFV